MKHSQAYLDRSYLDLKLKHWRISEEEIALAIKALQLDKAPGFDGVNFWCIIKREVVASIKLAFE